MSTLGNDKSENDKASGFLELIEKPWDIHWVLRFFSIVLYTDIILVICNMKGLLNLKDIGDIFTNHFGFLVVFVLLFCLLAALIIPILDAILARMICSRYYQAGGKDNKPGYVGIWEIRRYMRENHDEFLWRMYEMNERESRISIQHNKRIRRSLIACILLSIADCFMTRYDNSASPLMYAPIEMLSGDLQVIFCIIFWATMICSLFSGRFYTDFKWNSIYYPEFSRKDKDSSKASYAYRSRGQNLDK